MQSYIDHISGRVARLNDKRIARARLAMTPMVQNIFSLLPVLFQYNHPKLPGYISQDVACGVDLFSVSMHQMELVGSFFPEAQQLSEPSEPQILGLYSMGSTSSMGQSTTSNLDIWVCVSTCMSAESRELLERKASLISQWAFILGAEVNFFIVDERRFKDENVEQVTIENCGTTQHYLLLDEFYRTYMKLAGRDILWFLVHPNDEKYYDDYVHRLFTEGGVDRDRYIDFGGIQEIPAEEYFGSSLWQLYKSIDSPYKSVLKAIMLEVYSWEYPHPQLISMDMKASLHSDDYQEDVCLDAYVLMLEKVTRYLKHIKDEKRLDIVRFCFYLKTHEKLTMRSSPTQISAPWRRDALVNLVTEWDWSYERLQELDRRRLWKVSTVRNVHNQLFEAIMQSYRSLIRFARRNDISNAISPEDISILARKLYAAFEDLPGKISLLNKQLAPDLHEDDLSFIYVPEGRSNPHGWYLFTYPLTAKALLGKKSIEYTKSLIKLIGWSYFNNLLVDNTQLDVMAQYADIDKDKLYQLTQDIRTTFKYELPRPSLKALSSPCEVHDLALFLNLERDITLDYQEIVIADESVNLFNYGDEHINFVSSVDVLYRNSWNEIRSLHFTGKQSILDAVQVILGKMHHDATAPVTIDVYSYSHLLKEPLKKQVADLLNECIKMRLTPIDTEQYRHFKSLHIGQDIYGLFFERRGVSAQKLDNVLEFYSNISSSKLKSSLEYKMQGSSTEERQLSQLIDTYASSGLTQFFFNNKREEFSIFILDDENNLEVYHQCHKDKEEMIQEINNYYTSTQNKSFLDTNFNLPQFYDVLYDASGDLSILPYRRQS